jgi:hypothetical protein
LVLKNHIKGVKIGQNGSKPWAIVHAFWSKKPKNECFLILKNHIKGVEIGPKIDQNHGL